MALSHGLQGGIPALGHAMPATRQDLFTRLDQLGIAHTTVDHAPIFTVAEGVEIKRGMPGLHSKNLFLKSRDGRLFLLCAEGSADIRVNRLHRHLGCKRLSFGSPELMEDVLGVTPGSVTLFALINDTEGRVQLLLDQEMADAPIVNFHPLLNDATTAISGADAVRFAKATGHAPIILARTTLADSEMSQS